MSHCQDGKPHRQFFGAGALTKKREKREKKREEKFAQREACAENHAKEIEKECYSNINFIQLSRLFNSKTVIN